MAYQAAVFERRYGRLTVQEKATELIVIPQAASHALVIAPWQQEEGIDQASVGELELSDGTRTPVALFWTPEEEVGSLHESPTGLRGRHARCSIFRSPPTSESVRALVAAIPMAQEAHVDEEVWLTAEEQDVIQGARDAAQAETTAAQARTEQQIAQLTAAIGALQQAFQEQAEARPTFAAPKRGGVALGSGRGLAPPTPEALRALATLQTEVRSGLGVPLSGRPTQPLLGLAPGGQQSAAQNAGQGLLFGPANQPTAPSTQHLVLPPGGGTGGVANEIAEGIVAGLHALQDSGGLGTTSLTSGRGALAVLKVRSTFLSNPLAEHDYVVAQATTANGNVLAGNEADALQVFFERRVPLRSNLGKQIFTMVNLIHHALCEGDNALALGRIAGIYQALEDWGHSGSPQGGLSTVAWASLRTAPLAGGSWTCLATTNPNHTRLLANPAVAAAAAQEVRDQTTLAKLRTEAAELEKEPKK